MPLSRVSSLVGVWLCEVSGVSAVFVLEPTGTEVEVEVEIEVTSRG